MGGKSSSGIVGYKYFFGIHMGIGRGPVDALHEIRVGDKQAWIGEVTDNTTINIDKPGLFGGDDREGGIQGPLELMMGGPTQVASNGLQAMLGSVLPGFRGVFTAFFNGLVSGNNPYPKAWKFRLNRTLAGWDGAVFHPELAGIKLSYAESATSLANFPINGNGNANGGVFPGSYLDAPAASYPPEFDSTRAMFDFDGALTSSGISYGLTVRWRNVDGSLVTSDVLRDYKSLTINSSFSKFKILVAPPSWTSSWETYSPVVFQRLVFMVLGAEGVDRNVDFEVELKVGHAEYAVPPPAEDWLDINTWYVQVVIAVPGLGGPDANYTVVGQIPINSNYDSLGDFSVKAYAKDATYWVRVIYNGEVTFDFPIPWSFSGVTTRLDIPEVFVIANVGSTLFDCELYLDSLSVSGNDSLTAHSMNPAHIIYECLTNRVWGRGLGVDKIDVASFYEAAVALHGESFGLCLKWTRKDSIESFVQGVLDHIGGVLFVSRTTKLYTLKLIRSDYDLDDLTAFTTENGILEIRDATVASIGSSVNTVVVTYHDWQDDEDRTVSVKNVAAMRAAGGVVNTLSKTYIGIPTANLALRVAQRDLKAASTNLRRFTLVMDRRGESIEPGSVIAIEDASRGIPKMPVRVGRVEDGTITDGRITLTVVQDVFGLPSTSFATDVPSTWTPPNTTPCIDEQEVFEAPYFLMASRMTPADLDYVTADAGYMVALNSQGQSLNQGFNIAVRESAPTSDDNPPDTGYFCG